MKTTFPTRLVTIFLLIALPAFCAGANDDTKTEAEATVTDSGWDASSVSAGHLSALEHILRLNAEELAELRRTIDRIERLSEEQRQALRERIRDFHRLSERDRRRFIHDYQELSEEDRQLLRAYWQNLDPDQARQIRADMRNLSPEERSAMRKEMIAKAREMNLEPSDLPSPRRLPEAKRRSDQP